jgi:alanine dehydrogenase
MIMVLGRADVERLMPVAEYDAVVEEAFRAHADGRSLATGLLHTDADGGEFHIKSGGLRTPVRSYFGLKANGGFFDNPKRFGEPAIQGVIYLADAGTGAPLAVLDSVAITMSRTGAATAIAARHLAASTAHVVTVCGSGRQARVQLRALARARRLSAIYVWGINAEHVGAFAREMTDELKILVSPVTDIGAATSASDMIVTCTPATKAFLCLDDVRPGAFIAAVGADSPNKQELDARLVASSVVVTDVRQQSATVGEVHHAIVAGLMRPEDIRAELGEVITGRRVGRSDPSEIVIFDSTGTALQDVAAAAAIYERAVATGGGTRVTIAS